VDLHAVHARSTAQRWAARAVAGSKSAADVHFGSHHVAALAVPPEDGAALGLRDAAGHARHATADALSVAADAASAAWSRLVHSISLVRSASLARSALPARPVSADAGVLPAAVLAECASVPERASAVAEHCD